MSFLITVYVNEGIVMASDRRTTYTNTQIVDGKEVQRIGIHTTNSTDKTFICPNGAGISCCGEASLFNKPIAGFIQDMIRSEVAEGCHIKDIPQIIIDYFEKLGPLPDACFIVAGYDIVEGQSVPLIYKVSLQTKRIKSIDASFQGATWDGEIVTLTRLVQDVALKEEGKYIDLPYEDILWNYFTLQDAVDFARYAVETTIQTMRFKNVVETVGGGVDILVITPDKTEWLQKESLK